MSVELGCVEMSSLLLVSVGYNSTSSSRLLNGSEGRLAREVLDPPCG